VTPVKLFDQGNDSSQDEGGIFLPDSPRNVTADPETNENRRTFFSVPKKEITAISAHFPFRDVIDFGV
jgi:hypothetical protein